MLHGSSGFAGESSSDDSAHEYQGLPRPPARCCLQTTNPLMQTWELLPFSFVIDPPSGGVVTLLDWWLMQPLHWGPSDE